MRGPQRDAGSALVGVQARDLPLSFWSRASFWLGSLGRIAARRPQA